MGPSAAFEFGDEEDFTTGTDRLEIGGLVDLAVDRDGGLFFEVVTEPRVELVHLADSRRAGFWPRSQIRARRRYSAV